MAETATVSERSAVSIWIQATRPFSFTASMSPIIIGAMLALLFSGQARFELFPLIMICSLCYHAGANLISDYYDFKRGIDHEGTYGGSGVLVGKLLQPKQVLNAGLALLIVGFLLGLFLVGIRGLPMLYLGIIGFLGGVFYCATPFGYKYLALGDFFIFALFGPLMVLGSYYALTGDYNLGVMTIAIPVGFLVTAILHANNLRDINADASTGARTVANLLGLKGAQLWYYALVLGAFLAVALMVVLGNVKPWVLLVFLSLPPALKNIKAISGADLSNLEPIAMVDVQTAQHHFLFSMLLAVGLLLSVWL